MIKVVYAEDFLKDLKKLKGTPYYNSIKNLCFEKIPSLKTTSEIESLKKLKGHDSYFRVRKGDFRIGIKMEASIVTFLRCLPRKDIYKYFPKQIVKTGEPPERYSHCSLRCWPAYYRS